MKKILAVIAVAIPLVAVAVVLGTRAVADEHEPKVEIGEEFPNFKMTCTEGNEHNLEDYRGKVVLIEMASHLCPWSRGADVQLMEIYEEFKDQEVVVLGIDSHIDATPEEINEYAEEAGKTYPILKDEKHVFADKIGARVTPEIYVLDREGVLRYHGAFDNRVAPAEAGEEAYTRDAVAAVLAGEEIETARVRAWGCTIKRGS